jgi:hypothetical protein
MADIPTAKQAFIFFLNDWRVLVMARMGGNRENETFKRRPCNYEGG